MKIAWAAEQFLKGEKREKLARMLGLHSTTLWKILTRRSGDTWEVRFRSKELKIDKTITLSIPPLLSPETIKRINERVQGNKTYGHGPIKHQYLLARMVFCKKCGYTMFGQANRANTRYYRHVKGKERGCDMSLWCRADELEEAVLVRLFATLGDAAGIEAAMLKAIPDRGKVEELKGRKTFLESELSKVEASKNRLIQAVSDGLFSKDEVTKQIEEIRERETLFKSEIGGITAQLSSGPTEEEVRWKAKLLRRVIGEIYRSPSRLAEMSFDERRKTGLDFLRGKGCTKSAARSLSRKRPKEWRRSV